MTTVDAAWPVPSEGSRRLHARASGVSPGGVQGEGRTATPYPLFMTSARAPGSATSTAPRGQPRGARRRGDGRRQLAMSGRMNAAACSTEASGGRLASSFSIDSTSS